MNKIPVGRTIAQSYGFAFGRYFTTFGIIWLPTLLSAALTYYLREPMHQAMVASLHMTPGKMMPQFQQVNFLLQCASLIVFAIVSVGMTKAVLDLPRGPKFFYVGFGASELRVIAGYFAYLLLFIVFILAFVVAIVVFAAIAKTVAGAAATPQMTRTVIGLSILGVFFATWLALIYVMVRLTFMFLPVTVAEKRIGIMRSWELTAGNFWRIFAIGFVVVLPLFVLGLALSIAMFGTDYLAFIMAHANDPTAIQNRAVERVESYWHYLPYVMAGTLLINPVIYGLVISPASFAYRALVPAVVDAAPMPMLVPVPEEKKEEELPKVIAEIIDTPSDHGEDEKH